MSICLRTITVKVMVTFLKMFLQHLYIRDMVLIRKREKMTFFETHTPLVQNTEGNIWTIPWTRANLLFFFLPYWFWHWMDLWQAFSHMKYFILFTVLFIYSLLIYNSINITVTFNILLLLCFSTVSVACAKYLIYSVILFYLKEP